MTSDITMRAKRETHAAVIHPVTFVIGAGASCEASAAYIRAVSGTGDAGVSQVASMTEVFHQSTGFCPGGIFSEKIMGMLQFGTEEVIRQFYRTCATHDDFMETLFLATSLFRVTRFRTNMLRMMRPIIAKSS